VSWIDAVTDSFVFARNSGRAVMRISVAVGALPGYPLKTTLAMASEARADGVELLPSAGLSRRDPAPVQRAADDAGVRVLSVHAVLRFRAIDLATKTEDDTASIRFAAGLRDCEVVVLHPPLTGPRPSSDLNRWLNAIVAERDAHRPELRLAIENRAENHDGIEPQLLDDLAVMRSIAGEWGIDVTLDLAHAASRGTHISDALDIAFPKLANLHLSDARPGTARGGIRNGLYRDHLLPGDGYLPIDSVLQRLTSTGYDGLVTIELSPVSLHAWWPPAARNRMRDAVETVRSLSHMTVSINRSDIASERPARSSDR
jgi:sugar phosphate isomerase/epimerase